MAVARAPTSNRGGSHDDSSRGQVPRPVHSRALLALLDPGIADLPRRPLIPVLRPYRDVVTGVATPRAGVAPAGRSLLAGFAQGINIALAALTKAGAPNVAKGAHVWRKWVDVGLASPQPRHQASFACVFHEAMANAHHIHVNLDFVPEPQHVMTAYGHQGTFPDMDADAMSPHCVIADELFCLRHDPNLFAKTTFYVRGLPLAQAYALRDPIADVAALRAAGRSSRALETELRLALETIVAASERADPDALRRACVELAKRAQSLGLRNISALCRELATQASSRDAVARRRALTHVRAETYRTILACHDLLNPRLADERLAQNARAHDDEIGCKERGVRAGRDGHSQWQQLAGSISTTILGCMRIA